jgi:hypothetical protein
VLTGRSTVIVWPIPVQSGLRPTRPKATMCTRASGQPRRACTPLPPDCRRRAPDFRTHSTCTTRPYPHAATHQAKFAFSSRYRAQSSPSLCSSCSTTAPPCQGAACCRPRVPTSTSACVLHPKPMPHPPLVRSTFFSPSAQPREHLHGDNSL